MVKIRKNKDYFIVTKYRNKWAVYDCMTTAYMFMGMGKAYCERMAKQYNYMYWN